MRARYYCPYLMRFLNADPIGFSGGLNWFAYADGNPISNTDPFGLWSWTNTWGGLKAFGGVAEAAVGITIGAATAWTGIGAVGGALVAAHGVDTFQAGFRQMVSGEEVDTGTSSAFQAAGMSRQNANLVDAGIGLASGGAGLVSGATKTAGIMRTTEAAGMSVPKALLAWEKGSVALNTADFTALGGTTTNALSKAAQLANGFQTTTTALEGFTTSFGLWKTGLTPLGDLLMGSTAASSSGARILK